jgi:hypothetical protein
MIFVYLESRPTMYITHSQYNEHYTRSMVTATSVLSTTL